MIGRPSAFGEMYLEAHLFKIEAINEHINGSDFVFLVNGFIQGNWEQAGLFTVFGYNEFHT